MDLKLIDKISLDNVEELIDRDKKFRIVINHKKYDTSHEDDMARFVINNTKYKDMLLIRFEYYLSKTYHNLGKGDMVFYDLLNDKLYTIELKSLKDKYSNTTDGSKIDKCNNQSIKYAEYSLIWANKESIPVSIIENDDGAIQIIERTILPTRIENVEEEDKITGFKIRSNPWINTLEKKEQEEINSDKWFTHPGDQTDTRFHIKGDTMEIVRTVNEVDKLSANSRKAFRKRAKKICEECSTCTKYFCIVKNLQGEILFNELHSLNELESEIIQ